MFCKLNQPLLRTATLALVVCLAGCASMQPAHDDGSLQREAMAGTQSPVPPSLPLTNNLDAAAGDATGKSEISRGTGSFIQPAALNVPRSLATGDGAVTFNFENQPVQAVVKAILGDLLKQNYAIVPGVQGNISFSTSAPVDSTQALAILETLLSWTHNALVHRAGGYVVLPEKDAVAGNLVPSLGGHAPQGGLQSRLFPLHYISATEMQKLIKPFARADAVLLADSARNLIVMAGTSEELTNYSAMIRTFDVDWLRGMSVGVFNLQYATVGELMPKLDGMFGEHGDTPLAGMLRFIPIERTNAMVVISTQPQYLQEVGDWIAKIDSGGGNQPQLFVYDVRNLKASDLAKYLAQIYTNGGGGAGGGSDTNGKVGPGLTGGTLGSGDNSNGGTAMGSNAGSFGSSSGTGGIGSGGMGSSSGTTGGTSGLGGSSGGMTSGMGSNGGIGGSNSGLGGSAGSASGGLGGGSNGGASSDQQYASSDGSVHISSVDANNQLLVRARPAQWEEMKGAIKKLDNVPLQVQIETRILEVKLINEFKFGVQYYLDGLTGSTTDAAGTITPGQPYRHRNIGLGSGGTVPIAADTLFYSFINSNTQVAISALETNGNTKTLSAPSMVVLNNQLAHIQVGDQIPVNQTSLLGLGTGITGGTTASSVTYLSTGVILDVQPRVNPGGLVYLNVHQQVSLPGVQNAQGNYTISQRDVATQVAVQSGQTVLLGGLIQQTEGNNKTGVPILSDIPVLGSLFGTTDRTRGRTELIVLITPKVIRGSEDARRVTEEYQDKFESLQPLRHSTATPLSNGIPPAAAPAVITPLSTSGLAPASEPVPPPPRRGSATPVSTGSQPPTAPVTITPQPTAPQSTSPQSTSRQTTAAMAPASAPVPPLQSQRSASSTPIRIESHPAAAPATIAPQSTVAQALASAPAPLPPLRSTSSTVALTASQPAPAATAITPPSKSAPALASWPEQLQQRAEDALRKFDYSTAQDEALESWRKGTHRGTLCAHNWQVIVEARKLSDQLGSVVAARVQQGICQATPAV